jgi:D-alanyl-lipoteichoic acid acyltransferase DltB (MBOAT superfamily)
LLPQFFLKKEFDYLRVTSGLKLMTWGFFKKVVIADRVAILVDQVYGNPTDYTGFPLLIATYFFAIQIYCDFSGYSDIAIGAARVMGFDLMENFKRPYFSKSISEFWKRWHISLSTWFRDYLYISIGGNRVVKWRWYYNLMIVFIVSGMWHGANWTFLVWGALHGLYLLVSIWTERFREGLSGLLRINRSTQIQKFVKAAVTFHLVLFAWIFFRANSLSDAFFIIGNLLSGFDLSLQGYDLGLSNAGLALSVISITLMEIVELCQRRRPLGTLLIDRPLWLRWSVYYFAVFWIILFGVFNNNAFIYFQF